VQQASIRNERNNCVVFGGSGFLGQTLCRRLLIAGFNVRSVSRTGRPRGESKPWHSQVEWIATPLDSDLAVQSLVDANIVFHLASTTLPSSSNQDMPYDLQSNAVASLRLLHESAKLNIDRFIFVSSGGTIYGKPLQNPINEDHPTNPLCSYGIHKLAIEKYLNLFQHLYGLRSIILRVSNIYGEDQDCAKPIGAIAHFTSLALQGKPIEIWGDGKTVRDYVHVDDVASALLAAATYTGTISLFNIGSGIGTSLNDLLDTVKKYSLLPVSIIYKESRPFDVQANILDVTRAFRELAWQPSVSLQAGLRRMLNRELQAAANSARSRRSS
jgi:UDP-glucose 4-epimerase